MNLYTHKGKNIRKTWLLMVLFLGVVVGFGFFFSQIYGNPFILYIAVVLSIGMNIVGYWFSDKIVLRLHKAQRIEHDSHRELYNLLENLSISAGLPMPAFYIINDPSPNAFATGRDPAHAVVAVTSGLLDILDRTELEGVLAHELSHIGNRDMLVSTVAVVLVGFVAIVSDFFTRSLFFGGIGGGDDRERGGGLVLVLGIALAILAPLAASLIHMAISRKREFLADASGALLTRYPEGLARALEKISHSARPLTTAHNATAHLFLANPFGADHAGHHEMDTHRGTKGEKKGARKRSFFSNLFSTHPPLEERVAALVDGR